ncbi:chromosomal replication initiator DnaA [Arsenicitalea aurantiaca]|uniref:Chromosomal replication initiator DnaA n=1 Tax=Arsenicitalea aurantiaca TaxID=1783274 RepID=A0A433XAA5_9HYPH|nr:helix-turn-helix domain-containing protein [Arsenicitalea aurantiaca]RUT31027.1 chromosomal replication initiator DnaA [Arsenicitalea aurantiaca]
MPRGAGAGGRNGGETRDDGALLRFRRCSEPVRRLVEIVAHHRGLRPESLFHTSRCRAEIAFARQIAMYLMSTLLDKSLTETGRVFGRDRTTVAHACALIEDLRETAFDAELDPIEDEILAEAAAPEDFSDDRAEQVAVRHVA